MDPIITINEAIDVIATFKQTGGHIVVRPVRMRWKGRDIDLPQLGLCHPVQQHGHLHYIFDVSDGVNDYSLDFDTVNLAWTLISMIDGGSL